VIVEIVLLKLHTVWGLPAKNPVNVAPLAPHAVPHQQIARAFLIVGAKPFVIMVVVAQLAPKLVSKIAIAPIPQRVEVVIIV